MKPEYDFSLLGNDTDDKKQPVVEQDNEKRNEWLSYDNDFLFEEL